MTFLDFPESSSPSRKILKSTSVKPPAERILTRVPPKIEPIRSEVLSRVAAFLPQLAASNRAILQRKPEDINIEMLKGDESEVIEMKLGLGVFEEKISKESQSDTSSDSDEMINEQTVTKRKILVLPSEIRAAAQSDSNTIDPFERVINSLLFFDGSTDEEADSDPESVSSASTSVSDEEMEVLDFE
jgi:hypothetical protein